MTSLWSVVRLELREWRALPVLALVAGASIALTAAFAPSPALRSFATTVPELCWVAVTLIAGGVSFTRDLREGYTSFLLARPVATAIVWLGKLVTALTVGLGAYALCRLPLALWDRPHLPGLQSIPWALALTLLCAAVGYWIALAFTVRGLRLFADAFVSVGLLGIVAWCTQRLWFAGAFLGGRWLAMVWTVVLLLAGRSAVARGRGGRAPSYAAFTRVHWAGLAVWAAILGGLLWSLRSVEPGELKNAWIETASPDGAWLALHGRGRWFQRYASPTLIASSDGNGFVNAGLGGYWESVVGLTFSRDGLWCAWSSLQWDVLSTLEPVTRVVNLGSAEPVRTLRTPVRNASSSDEVAVPRLSPTGKGLLLRHPGGTVEVRPTGNDGTVWDRDHADSADFLDDDTVWILARGPKGRTFATFGRSKGEGRREVTLGGSAASSLQAAPTGSYGVALSREGATAIVERCDLVDGGCQAVWTDLQVSESSTSGVSIAELGFLHDGGFVVAARGTGGAAVGWQVRAFEPDGRPRWTLETPASQSGPQLVGEPYPGAVFVHVRIVRTPKERRDEPFPLLLVDTASGRVLRTEGDLKPTRFGMDWESGFRRGRAATFFSVRPEGLVRLDAATGSREPVTFR